jgi:uncharacterized protein
MNASLEPNDFSDLLATRLNRRTGLKIGLVATVGATAAMAKGSPAAAFTAPRGGNAGNLTFAPIKGVDAKVDAETLAIGYRSAVLIKWGDPITAGATALDLAKQSADTQKSQFGYNCDFVHVQPTDATGTNFVMSVNHEYTSGVHMFPGYPTTAEALKAAFTGDATKDAAKVWAQVEIEAHGMSVVEFSKRTDGTFAYNPAGARNRRFTGSTPMTLTGPASLDKRVGTSVNGTLNNCSGGHTPWGTVLTAEENFNQYFANADKCPDEAAKVNHLAMGISKGDSSRLWELADPRFDTVTNPFEPFKFGYVVEIDPMNPTAPAKKRTALGRFKHEAAVCFATADGRVAVYSGDDERFNHIYKFVTKSKLNYLNRSANLDLLDEGTLHVARFNADGSGEWKPLSFEADPTFWTSKNFTDQADICIRTRDAAAAVGATKMDRPEDIDVSHVNGHVFVACTNNSRRQSLTPDPAEAAANPRSDKDKGSPFGHIVEIIETNEDSASPTFRWEIFMLCGNGADLTKRIAKPADAKTFDQTYFAGFAGAVSTIAAPDNLAFDQSGNLIIVTDGMPSAINLNDGAFFVPVSGPGRGNVKQMYAAPAGAEVCGPMVFDNERAMTLAIQHPGEDAVIANGDPTSNTQSRWPESTVTGKPAVPKPSVVIVTKTNGGRIGS